MKMYSSKDPDKCCPICGVVLKNNHKCSQRTLGAIDSANTRALYNEDAFKNLRDPTEAERLAEGLLILTKEDMTDADLERNRSENRNITHTSKYY